MCRHLAYLGVPLALHELLYGAPHALARQARAPRYQDPPERNGDGFGAGWFAAEWPERYRSPAAIWTDGDFTERSAAIRSGAVVAAARHASPGATIDISGNAPFASGRWLFSLNGIVRGFYEGLGEELRAALTPRRREAVGGDADSEVLFAMALDHLDGGATAGDALRAVVATVTARTTGRFNLLLSDGLSVAATALGNSLFARRVDDAVTIASEPLDDDHRWARVLDGSLVEARSFPLSLVIDPLEDSA